jgi:predicted nucleotidyltransferase
VTTLPVLSPAERGCLERYLDLLADRLGDDLVEAVVFGSVARGEAWPRGMAIRSDLDLFVRTRRELTEPEKAELFDATYPLFLECGRQISPAIVAQPSATLAASVQADGIRVWPPE